MDEIQRGIEEGTIPKFDCGYRGARYECKQYAIEIKANARNGCVYCRIDCVVDFILPGYDNLAKAIIEEAAERVVEESAKLALKFTAKRVSLVGTMYDAADTADCLLECK